MLKSNKRSKDKRNVKTNQYIGIKRIQQAGKNIFNFIIIEGVENTERKMLSINTSF